MVDKITEVPLWQRVEEAKKRLAALPEDRRGGAAQILDRRAKFIADRLLKTDLELMPPQAVAKALSSLDQALSQINDYATTNNRQHAQQANEFLGQATQLVMVMPLAETEQVEQSVGNVVVQLQSAANAAITNIETQTHALKEQTGKLAESQGGLEKAIDSAKERTDVVVAEYQKQFSDNENRRAERFDKALEEAKAQFSETLKVLKQEAGIDRDGLTERANVFLKEMKKRDDETKALALAMGATGISANFQGTANQNQKAADRLRTGAILLLVVMAALIVWALLGNNQAPLEATLVRFLAALLLGIPATYLARESTRQRTEAIRSRRIELELSALGPFIESLDGDTKAALRKQLVETYFGRAFDKDEPEKDSIRLGGSLLDILKAGKELLKK